MEMRVGSLGTERTDPGSGTNSWRLESVTQADMGGQNMHYDAKASHWVGYDYHTHHRVAL